MWTLDRRGLCDAYVAHLPPGSHYLGHAKLADDAYIARRGVDIEPAHPILFVENDAAVREAPYNRPLCIGGPPCYACRLGADRNLLVRLPGGEANARIKFPRLEFHRLERTAGPGRSGYPTP